MTSLALLQLEGREKLDRPVHVLVLIRVDGSAVLRPADGGFGDAGGLAGQGGLNVDCDRHIVAALSDGWRHWRRRDDRITSVGGPKKKKDSVCRNTHRRLADPPFSAASRPDWSPCTGIGRCQSPE